MRPIAARISLFIFLFPLTSLSAHSQDNLLDTVVVHQSAGRADIVISQLVSTYHLKLNFSGERLARYQLPDDFIDTRLEDILIRICRATQSKFFIAKDGTITIISRDEEKNITAEDIADAKQESRKKPEMPLKFDVLVSGRVKDAETGEPLPNVSVGVSGTSQSVNTNVAGYFTLHHVPSDTAILVFTSVGYRVYKHYLSPSQPLDNIAVNIYNASSLLSEVVVTKRKEEAFRLNREMGMISLTPAKIVTLPAIGEKDIFRAFQLIPGVSAANEQSAGLYVHGGTPDENLVLFDGFTVYHVDHFFGFFSAFNPNAVKNVDLYKGGFESRYGGRVSAVVDITGKEGNNRQFNAGADIGFISLGAFAEGPLGSKTTFFVGFRQSFQTSLYNQILDKIDPNAASGGPPSPQNTTSTGGLPGGTSTVQSYFNDMNARLTFNPTKMDVISWSFYTGKDYLDNSISLPNGGLGLPGSSPVLRGQGGSDSVFGAGSNGITKRSNIGTSLKWSHQWNPEFFSNTLVSYSSYSASVNNTAQASVVENGTTINYKTGTIVNNQVKDYTFKTDFEWRPDEVQTIKFGWQSTYNEIQYQYAQTDTAYIVNQYPKGATHAAYLQDKLSLIQDRLKLTPGIRVSYFGPSGRWYEEPRITATYALTDKIKLKGSAGQYYQFAKHATLENVLQVSQDLWVLSNKDNLPVAGSQQYVFGAGWENENYLVDIEGYYRRLQGLTDYTLQFEPANASAVNYESFFYTGTGYARGVDLLLQKKFGKYNGWVGYTLGVVKNQFPVYGKDDFYADNDVRHEFKTAQTYKWKRLDFALIWILRTGMPYTAPAGGYSITLLDSTNRGYLTASAKNAYRLPDYQRLDLAITLNYGRSGKPNGTIGLSFFNVYGHKNVWYKSYQIVKNVIYETDVNYFGFTPNLSFSIRLK